MTDASLDDTGAIAKPLNRYEQIIEELFLSHYTEGAREVPFKRQEIKDVAQKLGIVLPENIGDVLYSFRYRSTLPSSIRRLAPAGTEWVIQPAGKAQYIFTATVQSQIVPNQLFSETKIPDATPGIIVKYALNDEQALLAILRYNRLIDIFTGVTCYSLQNHLRTTVPKIGQVETDELYVGVDKRGAHYVFPVQAKGGNDKINVVQIGQDFALCHAKFPNLICRSIAAQFMRDAVIALFEFEQLDDRIAIASEKHYRLVASGDVLPSDLQQYRTRSDDQV